MQKEQSQIERVVGMDMHPDIFTVAVMEGKDAGSAKVGALYDGIATERLEEWAKSIWAHWTWSFWKLRETVSKWSNGSRGWGWQRW